MTRSIPTTTNETIDKQRTKTKNPRQKLGLVAITEAPPCRDLPQDVCNKFDYRIALATTPDVDVSVSYAPVTIPPSSGWYNRPMFCVKPDSCLRVAIASSVGAPSQSGYLSFAKKYGYDTDPSIINPPPPSPDQNDGHYFRGYWMWELARRFSSGVINYSGSTWIQVQVFERKKFPDDPTRHNLTHCYPAEQKFCDKALADRLNPNTKSKTFSRSSAGEPRQYLQKILLGSMYKFNFEFENKMIDGYMTEKFYEGFRSRTFMVYCGASTAKEFAPGLRSYIDCHDFDNAEELVQHLNYLDQNHTAYLEYFEWKTSPLLPKFVEQFYRTRADSGYDYSTTFWIPKPGIK